MVKDSMIAKNINIIMICQHLKNNIFKECSVVGNVFEDENLLEDE